jgi:lariat debranching enzyme
MSSPVHVAVEGCCHGELDAIYSTIDYIRAEKRVPVELLLVCGDFECIRDETDLACVAVPPKHRKLTGFDDYVSGRKKANVLTIFVGGNHEASNVLHELYYGGWVAPNIYFLGFGGVVNYKGLRIGGLSGIYNERHYRLGHFERAPFTEDSMRSVYHVRELEVFRMAHLGETRSMQPRKMDMFLSHDWPADVWNHGDAQGLLRKKKFLADDMKQGRLGSPPLRSLLQELHPGYWFAAHLHVKFSALVPHYPQPRGGDAAGEVTYTKFLALDKVLPGR